MAKVYEQIDDRLAAWISEQPVFFVATAPLDAEGHLNLSPRGLDCLSVLGPRQVAWVDLAGSGVETIAHLRENGRIVLMWCAFSGPPKIVRVHGRGRTCLPGTPEFESVTAQHPHHLSTRAVIVVDVERISDSCGFGVPVMDLVQERDQLDRSAAHKGPEGVATYIAERNAVSLDGLPGLDPA
ncbi:MAG TPA: pyridoxamine 5'-phosphate oxidase family protein [Mycobacteriales bacterium]|nr:pyridoxamine 5'-phosphate oxidase family protein [Mycobacteriales bacterium]